MRPRSTQPGDAAEAAARRFAAVVAAIPRGCVASYGQVAELAGRPGAARQVGRWLFHLPAGTPLPWHRVVSASGAIPGASSRPLQRVRLEREDVAFSRSGRIDMSRYRWDGAPRRRTTPPTRRVGGRGALEPRGT